MYMFARVPKSSQVVFGKTLGSNMLTNCKTIFRGYSLDSHNGKLLRILF